MYTCLVRRLSNIQVNCFHGDRMLTQSEGSQWSRLCHSNWSTLSECGGISCGFCSQQANGVNFVQNFKVFDQICLVCGGCFPCLECSVVVPSGPPHSSGLSLTN